MSDLRFDNEVVILNAADQAWVKYNMTQVEPNWVTMETSI